MRILVLILTLAFAGLGAVAVPSLADAQPVPSAPTAAAPRGGVNATVVPRYPHKDRVESGGKALRTMAGSGGVVVMDDQTDIPKALWRILKFFAHESCGQCTPCREGTGWMEKVSRRIADGNGKPGDLELLGTIAHGIAGNTICALGDAAAWPAMGFLTKYRADFEAKIRKAAA